MIEHDEEGERAVRASKSGLRRVVGENDLHQYTMQGWHLVFSYEVDGEIEYFEQTDCGGPGRYAGQTIGKKTIGKVRRFVLGHTEDNSLALAYADAARERMLRSDAEIATRTATTNLDAAEKKLEELQKELEINKRHLERVENLATSHSERSRKMETSLAAKDLILNKIKNEIGAERFRLITKED